MYAGAWVVQLVTPMSQLTEVWRFESWWIAYLLFYLVVVVVFIPHGERDRVSMEIVMSVGELRDGVLVSMRDKNSRPKPA